MSDNPMHTTHTHTTSEAARSQRETASYEVDLAVAFTGFKSIPWLCISHNSLSPRLVLDGDDFLYKVIFTKRRCYAEIECADIKRVLLGCHLTLTFRDSIFAFSATLGDEAVLHRVITHLQLNGVEMGCGAREFIRESCAPAM